VLGERRHMEGEFPQREVVLFKRRIKLSKAEPARTLVQISSFSKHEKSISRQAPVVLVILMVDICINSLSDVRHAHRKPGPHLTLLPLLHSKHGRWTRRRRVNAMSFPVQAGDRFLTQAGREIALLEDNSPADVVRIPEPI
jgi:hypothetical protein